MPSPAAVLTGVLGGLLAQVRRPALVVTDLDLPPELAGLDGVVVRAPASTTGVQATPGAQGFRTVLLVAEDVPALRRAASAAAGLGTARVVGCVVGDADAVVVPRPHPSWPPLGDVDARLDGSTAITLVELSARHDAAAVLVALARQAAHPVVTGPGGLWTAGSTVPAADPLHARAYDPEAECPPDVLTGADVAPPPGESAVTGRAPLVVADAGEPLDEAVFNPTGFRRRWTRAMVELAPGTALSAGLVRGLRDAQGALLPPDADPRLVAGLAMSGVPTQAFDDPDERERHSVRTRRAALLTHSNVAWRTRLARAAGVRYDPLAADGLVVTTDDPDAVTDLLLARRYSGADLVVMPDVVGDPNGSTECFVASPPVGAVAHRADRTAEEIVAAGGLVYVTRAAGRT